MQHKNEHKEGPPFTLRIRANMHGAALGPTYPRFMIMTRKAHRSDRLSAGGKRRKEGVYRTIALVEVDETVMKGKTPAILSVRSRGMVRIVRRWESVRIGTTWRGAFQLALLEAEVLADRYETAYREGR